MKADMRTQPVDWDAPCIGGLSLNNLYQLFKMREARDKDCYCLVCGGYMPHGPLAHLCHSRTSVSSTESPHG